MEKKRKRVSLIIFSNLFFSKMSDNESKAKIQSLDNSHRNKEHSRTSSKMKACLLLLHMHASRKARETARRTKGMGAQLQSISCGNIQERLEDRSSKRVEADSCNIFSWGAQNSPTNSKQSMRQAESSLTEKPSCSMQIWQLRGRDVEFFWECSFRIRYLMLSMFLSLFFFQNYCRISWDSALI